MFCTNGRIFLQTERFLFAQQIVTLGLLFNSAFRRRREEKRRNENVTDSGRKEAR
jgi:hypothetical protein